MTKAAVAKDWSASLNTWLDGSKRSFPIPSYSAATFVNITPAAVTPGSQNTLLGNGLALDTKRGRILWCNGPFVSGGGLYRCDDWWFDTTPTWTRVGNCNPAFGGAATYITNPLHVEIDPDDPDRVYVTSGVRGDNLGFFISRDGGTTFFRPPGLTSALTTAGITGTAAVDLYQFAVDPTDFDHVIACFHTDWGAGYSNASGIVRTTDGGDTWTVLTPPTTWGTGHAPHFLYDVATVQGDAATWLVTTQTDGWWRTTNSGGAWTQVKTTAQVNMTHGGCQILYASDGKLYVPGDPAMYYSTDNGATYTSALTTQNWAIGSDGTTMFTKHATATGITQQAAVSAGTSWSNYGSTSFVGGPFKYRYYEPMDAFVISMWDEGVWVLKLH